MLVHQYEDSSLDETIKLAENFRHNLTLDESGDEITFKGNLREIYNEHTFIYIYSSPQFICKFVKLIYFTGLDKTQNSTLMSPIKVIVCIPNVPVREVRPLVSTSNFQPETVFSSQRHFSGVALKNSVIARPRLICKGANYDGAMQQEELCVTTNCDKTGAVQNKSLTQQEELCDSITKLESEKNFSNPNYFSGDALG